MKITPRLWDEKQQRDEFIYLCGVKLVQCCCFFAQHPRKQMNEILKKFHFSRFFGMKFQLKMLLQFFRSFSNLNGKTEEKKKIREKLICGLVYFLLLSGSFVNDVDWFWFLNVETEAFPKLSELTQGCQSFVELNPKLKISFFFYTARLEI